MAESIKDYWKSVRKIAAKLDPEAAERDAAEDEKEGRIHLERSGKEIWLISTANEATGSTAGTVVSATPWVAARYLKDHTHELASDEQVAAHKVELARRKEQIDREEADRKGVPTSKILEAFFATQQPAGGKARRAE